MAEASLESGYSRDDIIEHNLKAFLPYIYDHVKVTDLLVHLNYFTKEQRKRVFQLSTTNNNESVKMAMDILLKEVGDQGRFIAFREAMERGGYPNICQMLDGEKILSDENYCQIVNLFNAELAARLDSLALLPYLLQYGTLNWQDAETIRATEVNHGLSRANMALLLLLPNREPDWFKQFMNSLLDCDFEDIARIVEPDMCEKMLLQRQEAQTELERQALAENGDHIGTGSCNEEIPNTDMETQEAEPLDYDSLSNTSTMVKSFNGPVHDELTENMTFKSKVTTEKILEHSLSVSSASSDKLKNSSPPAKAGEEYTPGASGDIDMSTLDFQSLLTDNADDKLSTVGSSNTMVKANQSEAFKASGDNDLKSVTTDSEPATSKVNQSESTIQKTVGTSKEEKLEPGTSELKLPNANNRFGLGTGDLKLGLDRQDSLDAEANMETKVKVIVGESANAGHISYGRDFLLSLRNSPSTKQCPKEVRDMHDIYVGVVENGLTEGASNFSDGKYVAPPPGFIVEGRYGQQRSKFQSTKVSALPKQKGQPCKKEQSVPKSEEQDIDTTDKNGLDPLSGNLNNSKEGSPEKVKDKIIVNCFETDVDTGLKQPMLVDKPETDTNLIAEMEESTDDIFFDCITDIKEQPSARNTIDTSAEISLQATSEKGVAMETVAKEPAGLNMAESLNFDDLLSGEDGSAGDHGNGSNRAAAADMENDLDIIIDDSDPKDEDIEYNIPTDLDARPQAADEDIPLRNYQKELAEKGCAGDNVVIMAPTNSGKTRTACRIMQEHLRRKTQAGLIGKVVFLVENEALAFQQGEVCAKLLPAYRTKVFSGSVQRDKKQYLWDFLDIRDIFVVTAQILVNAINNKDIESLDVFTLIVFDECHHTDNNHRYKEIMSMYLDLKLKDKLDAAQLPQVVGLTASLGVGGGTTWKEAWNHMRNLLANHDAKFLCTVRRYKDELREYTNSPTEELVAVPGRVEDRFTNVVMEIKDKIEQHMQQHRAIRDMQDCDKIIEPFCTVSASFGSEKFPQWLSNFKKVIADVGSDEIRRVLNPCRLHLEAYNQALLLHYDARIVDAQASLTVFREQHRPAGDDTDDFLLQLYQEFSEMSFEQEPENPKLVRLEEIILEHLANNEDARAIMFVKTRELAKALVRWMKETEPMKRLAAIEFVGQTAPASQGGMTKTRQKDALTFFRGGRHKIIVATSVAEEGLDISKCNLVLRYEHVTNEIVRLQSRGRARAGESFYYVVSQEGSGVLAKEEKNAMLERLMCQVVPHLQAHIEDHQNIWERDMLAIQTRQKEEEDRLAMQRQEALDGDPVVIQCLNCGTPICTTLDVRKIQGAHHVIIEEECHKKMLFFRNPNPRFEEDELKFDGSILCCEETCLSPLGGVCEYRHVEFPLLKIKYLRFVELGQVNGYTEKKWKKANLPILDFTLDDLKEIADRRRERE